MTGPIEPATPAHAAAMAAIHRTAFPPAEAWGRDVMILQLEIHGCFGLIDPNGGMILVRVAADEAEVITLAVHPGGPRQGVGQGLLRAAMEGAREMGGTVMFLEVAVENDTARRLYTRMGFAEVGRRRNYYPGGADALVMRADLTGGGTEPPPTGRAPGR